ncbi:MAG: type I DNA topoisomerase, partial [Lachnoanaerobaculum sp.]|nr:type I DNA topoisomerase [Lachnoanaerobaculum sp.]
MAGSLVIVESPAKVKTIKKYLGSGYEVTASNGHVRDLPKSTIGIDVENDFEPKYITIRGKGELLAKLKKDVKKADKIYLATDPDREGEAISWHLSKALKLEDSEKKVFRISFNEITKNAIKEAIKHPRNLDMNLVDAQQARRVLDRMVGYSISPLLWAKVKRGLSAGRVQSVALRMICDREAQIDEFIPEEYWTLEAELLTEHSKKAVNAKFYGKKSKLTINNKAEMNKILKALKGASYVVSEINEGERVKKAPIPFTTSTLQQEASKKLNYSTQKTMRLAQQLYEGVEVKGKGTIALITYLRTDSTRIAAEADAAAREFVDKSYGPEYVSKNVVTKTNNNNVQDAHEAIRPTDVNLTPAMVKESLPRELFRLYQLIWKRFVASRMENAKYKTTSVKLSAGDYIFTMSGSKIVFDGFMSVYTDDDEEKVSSDAVIGKLKVGDELKLEKLLDVQHFTQPPAHFTEASLVKALEEQGIGRPSTYAPTITTILARHYIVKEQKNLYVTELGQIVNSMMVNYFGSIVDKEFTANLEQLLDSVGDGSVNWKTVVSNFYPDLESAVEQASKELENVKLADEVTDVICENCGRNMVIKYGPHGKFLACPGFPECKNTKPYLEKIGVKCPKCDGEVVIKKTK